MNQQERSMIEGLFQRLQQAEAQSGPRDGEAEALIHDLMSRQTAAPYLLAQVVLVQEQGLKQLQTRIEALEQERAERPQGGAFLGGLFGGGQTRPAAAVAPRAATGTGWSNTRFPAQGGQGAQPGAQGGGFMAGAMQTTRSSEPAEGGAARAAPLSSNPLKSHEVRGGVSSTPHP